MDGKYLQAAENLELEKIVLFFKTTNINNFFNGEAQW